MFDVYSLNLDGEVHSAVLSGPLFLEVGETLTLQVVSGEEKLMVKAKVHSVAQAASLMTVTLVDLDQQSLGLLAKVDLDS